MRLNKTKMKTRTFCALLGLLVGGGLLGSCSSPGTPSDSEPVAIAKREARSWGWKRLEIGKVCFVDRRWIIQVWRLPKTPGDNALIEVSEDGTVITSSGGR